MTNHEQFLIREMKSAFEVLNQKYEFKSSFIPAPSTISEFYNYNQMRSKLIIENALKRVGEEFIEEKRYITAENDNIIDFRVEEAHWQTVPTNGE